MNKKLQSRAVKAALQNVNFSDVKIKGMYRHMSCAHAAFFSDRLVRLAVWLRKNVLASMARDASISLGNIKHCHACEVAFALLRIWMFPFTSWKGLTCIPSMGSYMYFLDSLQPGLLKTHAHGYPMEL